ncbi:MAG: alpha/beta fold hydrolase [Candidatus Heimdallarchaeota archaeon]|nr:MAG: alpha/beta fold hydrolase [Candidatus Heimdallarchaeota archaeon]
MSTIRPRYLVLGISIVMILSGITAAWLVQNNFGTVKVTEIDLLTNEEVVIHSTLQVPNVASESNPVPGVVVIHGVYQSKEWLMAFGIELARRGFVVLTIDAASHGNSGYASSNDDTDRGGVCALEYLEALPYVSKLGMIGHSMGAGIAIQTLELTTLSIDSLVFVGGGSRNMTAWANSTYPKNLLITVGHYDELFDIPSLYTSLAPVFNTTNSISVKQQYGDFNLGTARKLVLGETNHLFETIDPIIISETVDWLKESLQGDNNSNGISKGDLIYPFFILGGLISTLGLLLSFFPLITILVDLPFFQVVKKKSVSEYSIRGRMYWIYGLLYAIITLGLFLPALLLPPIPFPQNLGSTVGLWLLGSSLLAFIALYLICRYQRKESTTNILCWVDLGVDSPHLKDPTTIRKSVFLTLIIIIWAYFWVLPVDLLLALDFRAFIPLFNDLPIDPPRLFTLPLYLIFTIPFFLVESMWLVGLLRVNASDTWFRTQVNWTTRAVVIKILPYVAILSIQFVMSWLIGSAFISGIFGFYLLFLWVLTPFFIISTTIIVWSYHLTKRVYIGAVLNALIFSWTLSSMMTLAM